MIKADSLVGKFRYALDNQFGYIWGKVHEMWSDEKQIEYARDYKDDVQRRASCEHGGKWAGHWVTDCSGIFVWAFRELGGQMYHGSNPMYREWCVNKGTLIKGLRSDSKALLPGSAVFTGDESNRGHVGLFVGDGVVIEAAGTLQGVTTSKVSDKKWTFWGELKGVDYADAHGTPDDHAQADDRPTLRKGASGEYVTLMQTKLIQRGYDLSPYGADGKFGTKTYNVLKKFQRDNGLSADGICGKNTWNALLSEEFKLYTVTIQHVSRNVAEEIVNTYGGFISEGK